MFVNPKKWIVAAGLIAAPLQAMAAVEVASFGTIEYNGSTYDNIANNGIPSTPGTFNRFTATGADGTVINVSGWSDTGGSNDDKIRRATDFDRNGNGWSLENADGEGNSSPQHSADNMDSNGDGYDYDFFLLDFGSKSVTLDSAIFSWRNNSTDQNQVSFAAIDRNDFLNGDGDVTLNGEKVNDLLNSANGSHGSSQMQWRGSNGNKFESIGNYYADTGFSASSTLWIVSAYNQAFGVPSTGASNYNDGFKLAGVSFSTLSGTTVPEPSTIAILGLALCGLTLRKRKIS